MSLLNRLEDAWRILDGVTGEVTTKGCGCLGRSGEPGGAEPRCEKDKLLDDIIKAAEFIKRRLKTKQP
jgi:hypothetical protein